MFEVRISDGVVECMTLAAIEAYCLGDGRTIRELETFGFIWGYVRNFDDRTAIYLDRASVSISAKRTSGSVAPHEQAATLKAQVINGWSPHLTMLGTFHSHPYRNLKEVRSIHGYKFSPGDFNFFLADDFIWTQSNNLPVMVVITVCRLGRVRSSIGGCWIKSNVWRYDVGEFRFWINIVVGYVKGDKKHTTGNTHSKVIFDLNTRFYNEAGARVLRQKPAKMPSSSGLK